MNIDPVGVATCEQGGSGGRAHSLGDIEIGELGSFFGHLVKVRRGKAFGTKYAYIVVALVVGENDDNVGLGRSLLAFSLGFGLAGAEQ